MPEFTILAEFPNRQELFDLSVNRKIDEIYTSIFPLINKKKVSEVSEIKISEFILNLDILRNFIRISSYTQSLRFKNLGLSTIVEYSNVKFSKFLQHLFFFIGNYYRNTKRQSSSQRKSCVDNIYYEILNKQGEYFVFKKQNGQIVTWIDSHTGDTALMLACKQGDSKVVQKLMDLLFIKFKPDTFYFTNELNAELKSYFFHENHNQISAWNRVLLERNIPLHKIFIEFGRKLKLNLKEFNDFLLQKNAQGDSVLIKAAKTRDIALLQGFLNTINIEFGGRAAKTLPYFLNEKNTAGFTVLNIACQSVNYEMVQRLLEAAQTTFTTKEDLAFFLNSVSILNRKISPLIIASRAGSTSIVSSLLNFARFNLYPEAPELYFKFINHEDEEGYTALMRASAMDRSGTVTHFIRICESNTWISENARLRILAFESSQKLTALEVAAKAYRIQSVSFLLDAMNIFNVESDEYKNFINHKDKDGLTPLEKMVIEQKELEDQMRLEKRAKPTVHELDQSKRRRIIARQLVDYHADIENVRSNAPEEWKFLYDRAHASHPLLSNLLGIFCSGRRRQKRDFNNHFCTLDEDDFSPSLALDKSSRILKETLFSMNAYIENLYSDSLRQVSVIRNQVFVSARESQELTRFEEVVNQYYLEHKSLLTSLKKDTVLNLVQAFAKNTEYILIHSGTDLLLLSKKAIFSPLLNPVKGLMLAKQAQNSQLIEQWLKSYFSKEYTIHPFNKEDIAPLSVEKFLTQPIHSDNLFMDLPIEGVSRKNIQELFLLKGEPIKSIDMAKDTFIQDKHSKLTFRAERFHKVFFDLSVEGKKAFKNLLIRYPFFTHVAYDVLNDEEKKYLANYGNRIMNLMLSRDADAIDETHLLEISINTHQGLLSDETDLKAIDKEAMINSLEDFKKRIQNTGKAHHKAALQLLVFMFPSVIRSMAERDPLQLAIPVAFMGCDMALNKLLVQFTKHPKVLQLFAGELSSKLLAISSKISEKVPVFGTALAIYGTIESANIFVRSSKEDPNHHYYKELLLNNLATLGVMGAEMALSLPFWPVLGVFAALTLQQVSVEGAIKENDLHLHDDEGHPLLNFYRRMELGFGIVDQHIKTLLEQRKLLDINLDYFLKLQSNTEPYSIMAITLPEVEVIKDSAICTPHTTQNSSLLISYSPDCKPETLHTNKKTKYKFDLGMTRNICQISDAFVNLSKNLTLLTATLADSSPMFWSDCSAGRKKISYGLASAEAGDASAALVINHSISNNISTGNSIFLPVDPSYITDYRFTFKYGVNESAQEGDIEVNNLLPCEYPLSFCIEKIVVLVSPLYPIESSDNRAKTKVFIDNRELKNIKNSRDKELIYLIRASSNLNLEALGLTKQSFLFFDESLVFEFKEGVLKTEDGFKVNLTEITHLRLEFGNDSRVMGQFEAVENQEIIINHLLGVDHDQIVNLKIQETNNFVIGLAGNSRLATEKLQIDVSSSIIDETIVTCYGAAGSKYSYKLMHPINRYYISKEDAVSFHLFNANLVIEVATMVLRLLDALSPINIDFTGHYFLKEKLYNSRIILNRSSGISNSWHFILKINIEKNLHDQLDIAKIQKKGFDQLTLVSIDNIKPIITHYIFLQNESLPAINGNFASFKFIDHDMGLLLFLQSTDENIQTFLMMDQSQEEIIINKIAYKIDWNYYSILAKIDPEKQIVIDAHQLLAPIQINTSFYEKNIDFLDSRLTLGNVTLRNVPLKLELQFEDKKVPIALIAYSKAMNSMHEQQEPRAEFIKDVDFHQNTSGQWWGYFPSVLAAVLTGCGFLFVRRFLSPKPAIAAINGAVVLPLLNAGEIEALSMKNNSGKDLSMLFGDDFDQLNSQSSYKNGLINFWDKGKYLSGQILSVKSKPLEDKFQTKTSDSFDFEITLKQLNFNDQLTFFYYVAKNLRRKFYNESTLYKNASNEDVFRDRRTNYCMKKNKANDCSISQFGSQYFIT